MSTFDTTKSIFFPLIPNGATATSCFNGFVCKEGNVNGFPSTFFSVEFIFNYTPSMTLNTIGAFMTLFHFGTDEKSPGICICLQNLTSTTTQIGVRQFNGSTWNNVDTFKPLAFVGSTTDTYMILFNFDLNGGSINLWGTRFNSTTATSQDFTITGTNPNKYNSVQYWSIGSITQLVNNNQAYYTGGTYGYNSYTAQNVQMSFMRTWERAVNLGSSQTSNTTYSMFNANPSYSLYNLNRLPSYISQTNFSTTGYNMEFQLGITGSVLYNSASSTANPVSTTGSTLLGSFTSSISNVSQMQPNGSNPTWWVNYNASFYTTTTGSTGSMYSIQTSTLACLLKGTKILTPIGYIPIEKLKKGDKILTHNFKVKEILEIYESVVYPMSDFLPCIIPKGKFNAFEDLYLSPHHGILIGKKFHCAKDLETERYKTDELLHYFHIRTEDYFKDTLVANGVVVETYNGNNLDEEYFVKYKLFTDKFNQRLLLL